MRELRIINKDQSHFQMYSPEDEIMLPLQVSLRGGDYGQCADYRSLGDIPLFDSDLSGSTGGSSSGETTGSVTSFQSETSSLTGG